jgi:hypothetical protein
MKRINKFLIFIFIVVMAMSCDKKSYESAFDKSAQERVADVIDSVRTKLTTAPNGWIGILSTGLGGGFSFYMQFDNQEVVNMYADLTGESSTVMKSSRYRVKQDAGVVLTFDTYNYISFLNSPDPNLFGGEVRNGFRSDIDFVFDRTTADSIIFHGKRYIQQFKLVKATAEQKAKYIDNASYINSIRSFKTYFNTRFNNYIDLGTTKVAIGVSTDSSRVSGKRVTFTREIDGSAVAVAQKFAFSIDKMAFTDNGITILGKRFVHIAWKDATTLALYDSEGGEYIIKQNPTPLINFLTVFAYNKSYNSIFLSDGKLSVGVTSDFNTTYAGLISRFTASGRTIRDFEVKLSNSNTIAIKLNYYANATPGTVFLAEATSTYTFENGIITLTGALSPNGNWTTRAVQIGDLGTFFQGKAFKPDWVASTVPGQNLGGLYRVDQPTAFVYGVLRKS